MTDPKGGSAEDLEVPIVWSGEVGAEGTWVRFSVVNVDGKLLARTYEWDEKGKKVRIASDRVILEFPNVPHPAQNEAGEPRVVIGEHAWAPGMFPGVLRQRLGILSRDIPLVMAFIDNFPGEPERISDSTALVVTHEGQLRVAPATPEPEGYADIVLKNWDVQRDPATAERAKLLLSFAVTPNLRTVAAYKLGGTVFQAFHPKRILPSLDIHGDPRTAKSTFTEACDSVFWGLRRLGLGGDVSLSDWRDAALAAATNLPLSLDERRSTAATEERGRHLRSAGLVTRGRRDQSVKAFRPIAPQSWSRNRRPEAAGTAAEAEGTARRTITLLMGPADLAAIAPRRVEFDQAFGPEATGPKGWVVWFLEGLSPRDVAALKAVGDKVLAKTGDERSAILTTGSYLAKQLDPKFPDIVYRDSPVESPVWRFVDFLQGQLAARLGTRTVGSANYPETRPLFPELATMIQPLDKDQEDTEVADKVVYVYVSQAFLDRQRGFDHAIGSLTDCRDLSAITGQKPDEIYSRGGPIPYLGRSRQRAALIKVDVFPSLSPTNGQTTLDSENPGSIDSPSETEPGEPAGSIPGSMPPPSEIPPDGTGIGENGTLYARARDGDDNTGSLVPLTGSTDEKKYGTGYGTGVVPPVPSRRSVHAGCGLCEGPGPHDCQPCIDCRQSMGAIP